MEDRTMTERSGSLTTSISVRLFRARFDWLARLGLVTSILTLCEAALSVAALAQSFPVTISFDYGDWKPPQAEPMSGWSIYSAVPDPTGSDAPTFKIARADANKFTYRIENVIFDGNWLHFASIQFDNPSAERVQAIQLPVRFTPEIVTAVDWTVKFTEPPSLPLDDAFEERVRKLRVGWDDKSKKGTLAAELSRYLEARQVWQQVLNEGSNYKYVKFLALRHGLESATNVQRFSKYGLYFDETFVDDAIRYLDSLPENDQNRAIVRARVGEVIFTSWMQIGNAVPGNALATNDRKRLCSMNLAYKKLGESWSAHADQYRRRYWDFKPVTTNMSLQDIATRLSTCGEEVAQGGQQ